MPPARALYLLRQVCHSLAEAHARGLVHRDIKPANIFVCRMGLDFDFVKVLDFGLVQIATRRSGAWPSPRRCATARRRLIGTPAYMAPEVILGRDDVDRRADVYALGCVAFYLLTGTARVPGRHADAGADRSRRTPRPWRRRAQVGHAIPRAVDELVLACLGRIRTSGPAMPRRSSIASPRAT